MLRAALLTLIILIVLPASASAACRTAPVRDVWYDSPALQVWADDDGFVTCVRATGTERLVRVADPEVQLELMGVLEDRWVRVARYAGYESDDTAIEWFGPDTFDAWTGAVVPGPGWPVPGGHVDSGPGGIVARYYDGRTEVLDATPTSPDLALVFQGRRVYWQTADGPRTALLNPPSEPVAPSAPLRARPMTRCTPRSGAQLIVRYRRIVVTRKAGSVHVCFNRRVTPIGAATAFERINASDIAYARPGHVGYLDAARGTKRELRSAGGPIAADAFTIAAVDREGVLRAWPDGRKRPRVITRAGASEVAVTPNEIFWLAPDGTPRVRAIS